MVVAAGLAGAVTAFIMGAALPRPRAPKVSTGLRKFEPTTARLERGRYLVENVADCFGCHSEVDWKQGGRPRPGTKGGGGHVADDLLPFKVYAPNISPDLETGAGTWLDEQFEHALRQGIGHDGRTLMPFMPYRFFRSLSDEDLASIIVYLRSIPPVRKRVPRTNWPEEMKGLFQPFPPLRSPVPPPDPSNPVKRGQYLVTVAGCRGCHTPVDEKFLPLPGLDLAGGQPLYGPWGRVASANLTPDPSGISYYDEELFLKTISSGKVGGVRPLNDIMPWRVFQNMTDRDLKDIFAYLRTVTPVRHRVDNSELLVYCPRCRNAHGYGDRN